jgi:hypothetical protein
MAIICAQSKIEKLIEDLRSVSCGFVLGFGAVFRVVPDFASGAGSEISFAAASVSSSRKARLSQIYLLRPRNQSHSGL